MRRKVAFIRLHSYFASKNVCRNFFLFDHETTQEGNILLKKLYLLYTLNAVVLKMMETIDRDRKQWLDELTLLEALNNHEKIERSE